jgi:hypothetical protein
LISTLNNYSRFQENRPPDGPLFLELIRSYSPGNDLWRTNSWITALARRIYKHKERERERRHIKNPFFVFRESEREKLSQFRGWFHSFRIYSVYHAWQGIVE